MYALFQTIIKWKDPLSNFWIFSVLNFLSEISQLMTKRIYSMVQFSLNLLEAQFILKILKLSCYITTVHTAQGDDWSKMRFVVPWCDFRAVIADSFVFIFLLQLVIMYIKVDGVSDAVVMMFMQLSSKTLSFFPNSKLTLKAHIHWYGHAKRLWFS